LISTVITHVYNEEYLLAHWIRHHVTRFDQGVVIDFQSTDRSTQIVKDLAPHWKIVNAPLDYFSAKETDDLVSQVESQIDGVKISLTVTEFFFGDPKDIQGDPEFVHGIDLVMKPGHPLDVNESFIDQFTLGVTEEVSMSYRPSYMGRALIVKPIQYPVGRHFKGFFGNKLIVRVANCFVSEEMIERRLQIQSRIPRADIDSGFGIQHVFPGHDGRDQLQDLARQLAEVAIDFKAEINSVRITEGKDPQLLEPRSLQLEIGRLQRIRNILESDIYNLRFQLKMSQELSKNYHDRLEEIWASRSWRWTLPLRKMFSTRRKNRSG
jgi:hypothetical protein